MSEQDADDVGANAFRDRVRAEIATILTENGRLDLIASRRTVDELVDLVIQHRTAGHDDGLAQGAKVAGLVEAWNFALPLIEAIAKWESDNGTLAAIMPSEDAAFCKLLASAAIRGSARAAMSTYRETTND